MSAWLCSQDHINLIVNAHPDPERRNGQSFRLLLNENLRSLATRYPDSDDEHREFAADYQFEAIEPWDLVKRVYGEQDDHYKKAYPACAKPLTSARVGAQIVKACESFDYQSCETDDWASTPAYAFVKEAHDHYQTSKKLDEEALWSF